MSSCPLVTVVGATGAQGGAVVRALAEIGKYKIRALTRNSTSEKAQALKKISNDIEIVQCDITKNDDVQRAFKDSWAVFALTDYWAQPDKPEVEVQQGTVMADAAALLKIPYYIFSMAEDIDKELKDKLSIPHVTQKAQICDYIKEKYPNLKTVFIEVGPYMQNWTTFSKVSKLDDGTIVFPLPVNQKTKLLLVDVNDLGPIVREILEDPEKFINQIIRLCGEEISFEDVSKTFTKVTGIPAISKTLTPEEFRTNLVWLPKKVLDELLDMYKLFEIHSSHEKPKDWTNGRKLTKLNTWEDWLRKTGWKGE